MTRMTPEFDQRVADWLEDDPNVAPSELTAIVLAALPSIEQRRRAWPIGGRYLAMTNVRQLAAVAVVIAAVGVGAATYFGGRPGGGGLTPPASPTPAPSVPTAAPGASSFTSTLYGYTVDRLPGWNVTPATVPWPGSVNDGTHPEWFDLFVQADAAHPNVGFMAVGAQPIPEGTATEDWMRAYAERQAGATYACKGPADAWVGEVVGTLTIRRIDIICDGRFPSGEDATGWHAAEVVFAVDGTGYAIRGNPEGVDALLRSFRPG